jgi:hypothetical protein
MAFVNVRADISGALSCLERVASEQVPFALALALTKTAQDVKADLRTAMQSTFDNPRKYTLNSLSVKRATKDNLTATVFVRSPSVANSLKAEIAGGLRDRAVEKVLAPVLPPGLFAVPGDKAKRGADGKVSISWVSGLLAKLGVTGRVSAKGTRRRSMAASGTYFLLTQRDGRLPPGIYQRTARNVWPLIVFTRQPSYHAKFDWYGIGAASAHQHFPQRFKEAAERAISTAR